MESGETGGAAAWLADFTQSLVCSRLTADGRGRITLSGRKLVTTVDGERSERPPATGHEVLAAYRDHFGITLDRVPVLPGTGNRGTGNRGS